MQTTEKAVTGERRFLLFLILPLLILAIANILYEQAFLHINADFFSLAISARPGPFHAELLARVMWFTTCLAAFVACIAVLIISTIAMRKNLDRHQLHTVLSIIVLLSTGILFALVLTENKTKFVNFELTLQLLSGAIMDAHLKRISIVAFLVVTMYVTTSMTILVAATTTVAGIAHNRGSPHELMLRMQRLKYLLYTGSIMMVTGIVNMGAWMRWPMASYQDEAEGIGGLALGVTTYWGCTFMLITAAIYVPVAWYLRQHAIGNFIREHPGANTAKQITWLEENQLTLKVGAQSGSIIALLSPFIAGPLSAILSELIKQIAS